MPANLFRYTDLTSLIYLLNRQAITLLDPSTWDDSNDTHYLTLYKEKKKLGSVLVLCFTETGERYHYWRVFANGSSGVCIQFRREALLADVLKRGSVNAAAVQYVTLKEARRSPVRTDDLPFLKRFAFKDECEFRLLYESQKIESKLDIKVSLETIERVTLSPWIHPSVRGAVTRLLHSIPGCEEMEIGRSKLIGNEEWKLFGERATEG